ncbi:MAG: DUF1570 domain-containing protein [Planctomycetota bacterium]
MPQTAAATLADDDKQSVHLNQVPFIRKKPDFGGEACGAAFLQSLGNQVDQDFVFDQSGVSPTLGRGCVTSELVTALKACRVQTGDVWFRANSSQQIRAVWSQIHTDLIKGRPTIAVAKKDAERFVLVTGYDQQNDEVIFHDPNQDDGADQKQDLSAFLDSMRLRSVDASGEESFQVVAIRCRGGKTNLTKSQERFSDADYAQHIRQLKTRLPNDEFSIVLQKPFVVVGDGGADKVKRTAERTVKWAVDCIKQDYFQRDPLHILDIWLFKNPESYQRHNVQLFGSKPTTPFGYYSSQHRALVMDISTGGGTLVHEIVHPFIESNFVLCPSWFNEGLASLYEQSSSRNGRIIGLTNWRLRGLQKTIEAERLATFKELCETSTREFYRGAGTNYAQARYLCYYLQERGLLNKFYHAFVKNAQDDPSGYETLQSVLGTEDMGSFQEKWEAYVLKLKF